MNRVGMGSQCSKDNILVFQGATSPLPNGIPMYTLEIQNVCLSGSCSISDIHMSCGGSVPPGWLTLGFSRGSGTMIALSTAGSHSTREKLCLFQYANNFKYPYTC
ncbi:hypothetical protein PHJA_002007400 [Phtheirospermum japonicum]|uniref:Uncharacterized protein n=1 Tax=Phtheirospermum japonicum TaxID=374723 RepID=A0A830CUD6_9LAMI|nr:hypothetical protein PHJA_002007400 [Phtheirospermum japonicum]